MSFDCLAVTVGSLRCEYLKDPIGIDVVRPGLSWTIESTRRGELQTAYQILVASSEGLLNKNQGDLWDSGKVASDETIQVEYGGKTLRSRAECFWKVRSWDKDGRASAWSSPAFWTMGLLEARDWQGCWIAADEESAPDSRSGSKPVNFASNTNSAAAALLRTEAQVAQKPVKATASICGLGYYELRVNGCKLGDHLLDPAWTDYDRRVTYVTYDVTDRFVRGANVVAVILGNGWFHVPTPDLFGNEQARWRATPRCLVQIDLEYADGSHRAIVSDDSWRCSTGAITFNCIRGGETIDCRLDKPGWDRPGFDAAGWKPVIKAAPPKGRLAAQMIPPMRGREVTAVKLTEPKPGLFIFDLGVNISGWARLTAAGQPGRKITLHFNELLNPDGTLNTGNSTFHTHGRFQTGELFLDRSGRGVFEPRFTYHGFRYVQVTGLDHAPALDDLVGVWVHSDLNQAGEFSCSNPLINQIQKAVCRTILNTTHSIPGEESTREKMGWTQDAFTQMEPGICNFDESAMYRNFLRDMIEAQDANGQIPPIVPTCDWGRSRNGAPAEFADPWWGDTLPYVAWKLYQYYGDKAALVEAYEPMKRWTDYQDSTAANGIVAWSLGDWLDAGQAAHKPHNTPTDQVSTCGFYYAAQCTARAARLLGKDADAQRYGDLADRIRHSFNKRFLDSSSGIYAPLAQTGQVLPLSLGIVPPELVDSAQRHLVEDIHNQNLTAGFVGIMPLMYYLVDHGQGELAYTLATQFMPGWGHMVADDWSTLGESLYDNSDRHHPFGGCIGSWYYGALAGLRPGADVIGYKKIVIKPRALGGLTWVNCYNNSIRGRIVSNWKRSGNKFEMSISIPANTTAAVYVPAKEIGTVTESGKAVSKATDLKILKVESGFAVFEVGSGDYIFTSEMEPPSVD